MALKFTKFSLRYTTNNKQGKLHEKKRQKEKKGTHKK